MSIPCCCGRRAVALLMMTLVSLAAGCDGFVKSAMLSAPNKGDTFDGDLNRPQPGPSLFNVDRELFVPVGPPEAVLRLWVKDPVADNDEPPAAARGTILVVHGWRGESMWISHVGDAIAAAGFRAVHVDLRGHGGSTGDTITYGAVESRDLVQVLEAIEKHDLVEGPLGVWGVSMGGATAIQFAAREPRVEAVVAVAPYTSMREVAPLVTRRLLPLMHLAGDEKLDQLVQEAADANGFDPDEADTLAAIQQVRAPVLIIHGKGDAIVPVEHGRRLYEAATGPCELIELDWTGHLLAHFSGEMAGYSIAFFEEALASDAAAEGN